MWITVYQLIVRHASGLEAKRFIGNMVRGRRFPKVLNVIQRAPNMAKFGKSGGRVQKFDIIVLNIYNTDAKNAARVALY
jgi:hypothetical protein